MIFDRICAIATPPGVSALGMIRCSGNGTHDAVRPSLQGIAAIRPRTAHTARFVSDRGAIDEVVAVFYSSPASYTGEDMVEITFHGSPLILRTALQCLLKNGFRQAFPGEFTKRAVLNNKMDLIKAESINALVTAPTSRSLEAAVSAYKGGLSRAVEGLRGEIISVLAEIEVELNYPEDHVSDRQLLNSNLGLLLSRISELISKGENGIVLTHGVKTVIVGRPNVGKSTLLNALLKKDRAIVTDTPGTTRDTIEEALSIQGVYFRIVDTAGIRKDAGGIEYLGVRRSYEAIERADLCLFIVDLSDYEEDLHLLQETAKTMRRHLVVGNKKDIQKDITACEECDVKISARSSEGLEDLEEAMIERTSEITDLHDGEVIVSERQKHLLHKCKDLLSVAISSLEQGESIDISSSLLNQSVSALDDLTGRRVTEDLLDKMFSDFCVGK